MLKDDKLMIFILTSMEMWRCHDGRLYKYQTGSWDPANQLEFENQEILSATDGIFVTLADDKSLPWRWDEVKEKLTEIV